MTRRYAIGDIHGCSDELRRVLELIRKDAAQHGIRRPKIVLLGDYVDRGPDSKGVLDILTAEAFQAEFDPVFLLGNHEAMMIAALKGQDTSTWLQVGGAECIESYGVETGGRSLSTVLKNFKTAVPFTHKAFLQAMQTHHVDPPYLFSHAGIDPDAPLHEQYYGALVWGDKNFLTSTRNHPLFIVHGHWADRIVIEKPNRLGIDTKCGMGGHLTAVALTDQEWFVL